MPSDINVSLLVCDEIRIEITGKLIIIGLYTGDISVPVDGTFIQRLNFLFSVDGPLSSKPDEVQFKLTLPKTETNLSVGPVGTFLNPGGLRKKWLLRHSVGVVNQQLYSGKIMASVIFNGEEHIPSTPWIAVVETPIGPIVSPPPAAQSPTVRRQKVKRL